MIDHLSIGTADIDRARTFYDVTLGALGYQCLSTEASALGYGRHGIAFWVLASFAVDPDGYRIEAYCNVSG